MLESLVDILHVGSAARDDDSGQEHVGISAVDNLCHRVGHDLGESCIDNLMDSDDLLLRSVGRLIHFLLEFRRVLLRVDIRVSVLHKHVLGLVLLDLEERLEVVDDIVESDGYGDEVSDDILLVYHNRSGSCTEVHHGTSSPLLLLCEHVLGEFDGREFRSGDVQPHVVEACLYVASELLTCDDVEELSLDVRSEDPLRVVGRRRVHDISLRYVLE